MAARWVQCNMCMHSMQQMSHLICFTSFTSQIIIMKKSFNYVTI